MSNTTDIEDKSASRFRIPRHMPADEVMFAGLQRHRLRSSGLQLDDEAKLELARLNSLHNVGIHPHFDDPEPKTLAIRLKGVRATFSSRVIDEITRTGRSRNPLVRAVVDKKLGAVHEPGHPLAAKEPSVITITTLRPKLVARHLRKLSIVKKVNALN